MIVPPKSWDIRNDKTPPALPTSPGCEPDLLGTWRRGTLYPSGR